MKKSKKLEYVVRCPECKMDTPVVTQGEKDTETYCYNCERYFKGDEVVNGATEIRNDIRTIEALVK